MTARAGRGGGRGILYRRTALERFHVERRAPAGDIAWFADHIWVLTWDLTDHGPHRQQVLTHPAVNLSFRPGGFRPLLGAPVSGVTDRFVPVEEIFGPASRVTADAITAEPGAGEAVARVEDFLRSHAPERPYPLVAEVAAIVARVAADPGLLRVDEPATSLGTGTRRLQRIFAEYVGVGPG